MSDGTPPYTLWLQWLGKFIGQQAHGLEIGSWKGNSASWLCQNILMHPGSTLTCIDDLSGVGEQPKLSPDQIRRDFEATTEPWKNKIRTMWGKSQEMMLRLNGEMFDFVYIDASHLAIDVLADALCAHSLCRPGAVMIFDDYGLRRDPATDARIGIDAFVETHNCRVLFAEYQLAIEIR